MHILFKPSVVVPVYHWCTSPGNVKPFVQKALDSTAFSVESKQSLA